ncbi:L-rhamnose isomerase, partial [Enterobacter quasiroggenkampii]
DYKFGSLTSSNEKVRRRAIEHHRECIDVMRATGSTELKIWLADGTNYAGQDSMRARQDRLAASLTEIYAELDDNHRMVLEYKFFEPAFYHTDVPDWGTRLLHCLTLGEKAMVVLDTGHHAPGTNIEFIVAQLIRQGRLG